MKTKRNTLSWFVGVLLLFGGALKARDAVPIASQPATQPSTEPGIAAGYEQRSTSEHVLTK